jgi:hypothetical protein
MEIHALKRDIDVLKTHIQMTFEEMLYRQKEFIIFDELDVNNSQGNFSATYNKTTGLLTNNTDKPIILAVSGCIYTDIITEISIQIRKNNNSSDNYSVSTVSIGNKSGQNYKKSNAISRGDSAGQNNQGTNSIAIGNRSGEDRQSENSLAIGNSAGFRIQSSYSVAIGNYSGYESQGVATVAVGYSSGYEYQGNYSLAIGNYSGSSNQGDFSIAIGNTYEKVLNPQPARSDPNKLNEHRWTMYVCGDDGISCPIK